MLPAKSESLWCETVGAQNEVLKNDNIYKKGM